MILGKINKCIIFVFYLIFIFFAITFAQDGKSKNEIRRECRTYLKNATKLIESGQIDSAMVLLDEVLKLDDENPDAYYYKGELITQSGDTTKAIEFLLNGVEKAPRSTRLKLLLAHLQINQNNIADAETFLDQILAIKPNDGEALYYKGTIMMLKGDSSGAVDYFEKALNHIDKKN